MRRERRLPFAGAASSWHGGSPVRNDGQQGEEPRHGLGAIAEDEDGAVPMVGFLFKKEASTATCFGRRGLWACAVDKSCVKLMCGNSHRLIFIRGCVDWCWKLSIFYSIVLAMWWLFGFGLFSGFVVDWLMARRRALLKSGSA